MEFSLRYPPVRGRLHTRYAPVRRSPAEYCYSLLPLDLHVLSLPLAFILSQDQTLHCKNCSFTFLTRLRVSHIPFIYMCDDTRYLYPLIRFKILSLPTTHFSTHSPLRQKRVQRYNLFPFHQNIFSSQIHTNTATLCAAMDCRQKNFSKYPPEGAAGSRKCVPERTKQGKFGNAQYPLRHNFRVFL